MNCSKTQKFISPYIDGELSEGTKRNLESHIKDCEKCRTEMKAMQELHQLFVSTEKFKAPHGFHTRVMANVNTAKGTGWLSGISIPVRLAEAVMVLVLIAVGILSGSLLGKGLAPAKVGNEMAALHLDVFNSAPPGTLGGAYLAMTEERNEK